LKKWVVMKNRSKIEDDDDGGGGGGGGQRFN
jgi:hypothetical protein